jgi:hypothetical protein
MPFAGPDDLAARLVLEIIAIGEDFVDRTGLRENLRIGRNPCDGAQYERGHAELRVAADDFIEPRLARLMVRVSRRNA